MAEATTTQPPASPTTQITPGRLLVYLLFGIYFGIVLTKSEVISWFRIQEMFRFQSFHMYGVIGGALAVAALSTWLIKRFQVTDATGAAIKPSVYPTNTPHRYWIGGTIFGLGWALTGACPGPLFALVGSGVAVFIVAILSAAAGTWVYGALKPNLPH